MWPDVLFSYAYAGWLWPDIAQCLPSLVPHFLPAISLALPFDSSNVLASCGSAST
jgi:hypothetical protein